MAQQDIQISVPIIGVGSSPVAYADQILDEGTNMTLDEVAKKSVVYGPYASVAAAHTALSDVGLNTVGTTVGISGSNNTVVEYWYQGGTAQANLVEKSSGGGGGSEQIQSDWNQTDSTKKDFIKNKPNIPDTSDYYTKSQSDEKYQPAGNYQPAGDYATKTELNGKVDKVSGKGLSTNDYTNEDKARVAAAITEHQDISGKVDKIAGKGLSTNDYTNEEKQKVADALVPADIAGKANASDVYTKSETYTKTEVNGLVDTPHQEYVTVDAYSNLPATGSKDTIYRVSNYNGSTSQVDASVYSEYAWNGSQYVFLCVKSQIDEVFDISVYNNNAKYADLAAALNGGANIPQSLQKGGMSVKFVRSSDNKYVQARLMANAFTTDVTQWQMVTNAISVGSKNIPESGAVSKKVNISGAELFNKIVDGCLLYGDWEHGTINPINGYFSDASYRIRTKTKVCFMDDVTIKIKAGFILYRVNYEGENDTTPTSHDTAYQLDTMVIPKNTWMNFVIRRNTDDESETADIKEFLTKVEVTSVFGTKIAQNATNISMLTGNLNTLSTTVNTNNNYVLDAEDYENDNNHLTERFSTLGSFERGAVSTSTGDYARISRIRSRNKHTYKKDVYLHVKSGYNVYLYTYNSVSDTIPNSEIEYSSVGRYRIQANTLFRIEVNKIPENISEAADINEFKQACLIEAEPYAIKENVDILFDNDSYINPRKNLFSKKYLYNYLITTVSGESVLRESARSRCLIIPLLDFGDWSYTFTENGVDKTISRGCFLKISGLKGVKWGHIAILLDKNMQPVGSNSLPLSKWDWETDDVVLDLKYAGSYLAKYIAIKVYDGSDLGNQNPSNGYVWSDAETEVLWPNWDIVINFNFENDVDAKERKQTEFGSSYDWFDDPKRYCVQKFGNDYYDKMYKLSYLTYHQNFNFLLASDSHIQANGASFRNLKDFIDFGSSEFMSSQLDCILHNGDMIAVNRYFMTTKQRVIDTLVDYYSIVKDSGVDFIQSIGNHDKGQDSGLNYNVALTNAESVTLMKEYTKHTADTLYQYYDYADKKVRIIKIDAYDYPLEDDGNGNVKYNLALYNGYISQTQFQWIVSTLLSTPTGYNVIVTGHIYPQHKLVTQITELMYALKNKVSGIAHIDLSTETLVPPNPTFDVSYDFTGANNVNIVGLFCGHDHMDSCVISSGEPDGDGKYTNTIDNDKVAVNTHGITVMGIRCQMMRDITWRTHRDRMPYTDSQNCFNMMSVDTKNKKLYVLRYGVEADTISSANVVPILYGREDFDIM